MAKEGENMTLRDQFAMSALAALSGGSWNDGIASMVHGGRKHSLVVSAYLIADEMLEVREIPNLMEGV